jgi:ATP-binding cassette subfamily F protein uup
LLLAKIFTGSANLMVLDEPTNDLDVDTLELLEDLLADYEGTLLLVSHDRAFLDNVVTSTLVFEGGGKIGEYVGGYEDWERYRRRAGAEPPPPSRRAAALPAVAAPEEPVKARKLSYKEQRELEALPEKIESLEAERSELRTAISDADFYRQPGGKIAAAMERLEALDGEIDACYLRWQLLQAEADAAAGSMGDAKTK